MKTAKEYLEQIKFQLLTNNHELVDNICHTIINNLFSSDIEFDKNIAAKILGSLRSKRKFTLMGKLGDALILTNRASPKIRRLHAQSLIEQGNYSAAMSILNELINNLKIETNKDIMDKDEKEVKESQSELHEASGILGRIYKQLYIHADSPKTSHCKNYLQKAINCYYDEYIKDPFNLTWQGINTVAILKRAEKDNVEIKRKDLPTANEIAEEVLHAILKKHAEHEASDPKTQKEFPKIDAWNYATACEACIALNKPKEALEWISGYARMEDCDAFELASTLRQFTEVWQLDLSSEIGLMVLPILQAEYLKKDDGDLTLNFKELQLFNQSQQKISDQYINLIQNHNNNKDNKLEKVFGEDSFNTYAWFMKGVNRCRKVARIGLEASKGFGTGFLLNAKQLYEAWEDEYVLITNSHVICNSKNLDALHPDEAIIIFEAIDAKKEFKVSNLLWTSPIPELDATIVNFNKTYHDILKEFFLEIEEYPISKRLPLIKDRIYIIGHPKGGTLQFSLYDNVLLESSESKIQYRTPTEEGSSGSPVFNKQWELIGLHHAGDELMRKLSCKDFHEANEGIWIQAIKNKIAEDKPQWR